MYNIFRLSFLMTILFFSHGLCGGTFDYEALTKDCILAYQNHYFDEAIEYDAQEKIYHFKGYAGDINTFLCKYEVYMKIDFSKKTLSGEYYYLRNKNKKMRIKGVIDKKNNIVLKEVIGKNKEGYIFKGVFAQNVLKGVWSKGGDKKQFPLWAEWTKRTP